MLKMLAAVYGLDEAFHLYEHIKHRVLEAWVERARRVLDYAAKVKRDISRAWQSRIYSMTGYPRGETTNMAWGRRIACHA